MQSLIDGRFIVSKRYPFLRFFHTFDKYIAYIIFILAGLLILFGKPLIVYGLISLALNIFACLIMIVSEIIYIFIETEENTRKTTQILEQILSVMQKTS